MKLVAGLCALTVLLAACSGGEAVDSSEDELMRKTAASSRWSYQGMIPKLDAPRLVVSLSGHTAHVTGLLPTDHQTPLPYYAITEPTSGGRTLVHLVYPIATVDPRGTTTEGLPTRNPEPFDYKVCGGDNHHESNEIGSFGGFPFIEYVCNHREADGRVRGGIAFHGPITSESHEGATYWSLKRGPVSHACNRMLGEHVLELAHAIGFDVGVRGQPVKVVRELDTFHGRTIDVDHPATNWTRPAPTESVVFPIWQAVKVGSEGGLELDFPRWACETSRCASMPPNKGDPETGGLSRGAIGCPSRHHVEAVGRGSLCINDVDGTALGPYTAAMVAACRSSGDASVCASNAWPATVARRVRGDGLCPAGARFDTITGYCMEGNDAFGPFPEPLVQRCLGENQSAATCRSARWGRFFLARLQGRLP